MRSGSSSETAHVRVDGTLWSQPIAQPEKTPVPPIRSEPAAASEKSPAKGSTPKNVDVESQEAAIAQREAVAMRNRQTFPAGAPARRVAAPLPALPEPVVSRPQPTVEPAETPMPTSKEIYYGADEGFRSITGQVEQYHKTWRLRYGHVSQEDLYGGVVVLEGGAELGRLEDGRHVRVTGVVIPPTTRTGTAIYRVKTMELLD